MTDPFIPAAILDEDVVNAPYEARKAAFRAQVREALAASPLLPLYYDATVGAALARKAASGPGASGTGSAARKAQAKQADAVAEAYKTAIMAAFSGPQDPRGYEVVGVLFDLVAEAEATSESRVALLGKVRSFNTGNFYWGR